jgi:hypothetical protein
MLIQKTHFKQVPLEFVRKLMEQQTRQETAAQRDQATGEDAAKPNPSGAREKAASKSGAPSPLEVWTRW